MNILLIFMLLLLPATAFAQGSAIRSASGKGTNTLLYSTGGVLSLDLTARLSHNSIGTKSLDWENNTLWDSGVASVSWGNRLMKDSGGFNALDWEDRKLNDSAAATALDWNARTFSGTAWVFLSITNHSDVSAGAFASGNVWGYDGLTSKWTNGPPTVVITLTNAVGASFDGAGAAVAVGSKAYSSVDRAGTIYEWEIIANGISPTCTIDVWKIAAGTAIPTIANTIMGTKPALTVNNVLRSSTTTGWTTLALAKGDILIFNVDACSVATQLQFKFVYR
jgi:hypothetical protein